MTDAEKLALEIAGEYNSSETRLCRDTSFPDAPQCYVAMEWPDNAIVVYLDEPDTCVSTGNHAGRFQGVAP